jgi:VWFA-related protein
VYRSSVDYVAVDVVVTDKHDRPITGLTKEDFEIIDQGQPQELVDWRFVYVPLPAANLRPDELTTPPLDVASNRPPSALSRLFALVIDDLHIIPDNIISVQRVMREFLNALTPDDEVAVVFVGHSNLGENFTTDRARLYQTVDRVRSALGFGLDALGRSANNDRTAQASLLLRFATTADQTLTNIARAMSGSTHARRAIVYVTEGSVLPTTDGPGQHFLTDSHELAELYEVAHRANVPIYTIDPRGQVIAEDAVRGGLGAIGGIDRSPGQTQRARIASNISRQRQRLAENAINTGGRAFTSQSDLRKAVREIVADNGSYYVLGYYPHPFDNDGKYHPIKVRVKRSGVRVRARDGYKTSSPAGSGEATRSMLDRALSSTVNISGIGLRATALPLIPSQLGTRTVVTFEVTYPGRITTFDDAVHWSVVAVDSDAKVKVRSDKSLGFPNAARSEKPVTFVVNDVLDLPTQPLALRVGLASLAVGLAGVVELPLDVTNLDGGTLRLSGIAIGLANVAPTVLNAEALSSLVPFQPLTTREFDSSETLRVFGRAFWKARNDPSVTFTIKAAEYVPHSAGRSDVTANTTFKPKEWLLPVAGTADPRGGKQASFDVKIPLADLPPRGYLLEIRARLNDEPPVNRIIPFWVR